MKKWQNDWNAKKIIVRHQTFRAFPLSKVFTTFSWRGFVCLKFLWWQTILFNVVYSWSFNSKFKNFILTKLDNFKRTISNLFQKRLVWNWTVLITSWSLFCECWEIGLNFHRKLIVQNCSRIPFISWISHLRKKIGLLLVLVFPLSSSHDLFVLVRYKMCFSNVLWGELKYFIFFCIKFSLERTLKNSCRRTI